MSHVVSGLLDKRSELLGIIEFKLREVKTLEEQVSNLEAALKIFDSEIDLRNLKGKRVYNSNKLFAHGELSKLILETLRIGGMDYESLMMKIMEIKSIDESNKKALNKILKVALATLVKSNKVKKVDGEYSIVGL